MLLLRHRNIRVTVERFNNRYAHAECVRVRGVAPAWHYRLSRGSCGELSRDVGEKKGNLVIKQLHLLHTSEHLNERAAVRVVFYLSCIKTRILRRNERRFSVFCKEKRNRGDCFRILQKREDATPEKLFVFRRDLISRETKGHIFQFGKQEDE